MATRKAPPKPFEKDYNEAVYHRPPAGLSFFKTGVLVAILLLILFYFAFAKSLPFGSPYEVTATFDNAATLRVNSPVRIAGVNVGEVTGIEPQGDAAKVTFTVDEDGLPLHADAVITIRSRLFLEGNFFLDLRPGSPSAAEIADGGSIPVTQTATGVQLDEVLTALQNDDRDNLRILLDGYGSALADKPSAGEDADQDPDVRGESAAESLNDSFDYGGEAGKTTAQVTQALLGSEPGDLSGLIRASAEVFGELADSETQLQSLITSFATTTGALADEQANLRATLRELAPTLEQAGPDLLALNSTFPPLRAFARELRPGILELPGTIEAANPWLEQALPLLGSDELGGIAGQLRAATPALARGVSALGSLMPDLGLTARCLSEVLVPAGDAVIGDDFSTGVSNFHEFLYGASSQAGEGAEFDGNGQFLRVLPNTGSTRVASPNPGGSTNNDILYANSSVPPLGTQPDAPAQDPPVRPDVACDQNEVPALNGPAAAVAPPTPAVVP